MMKSDFTLENNLLSGGYDFIIGVDEAGRGPLAGPVVAVAASFKKLEILNPKSEINSKSGIQNLKFLDLIRDSKTLNEKQREKIFDFILDNFHVGIGICDHATIDRINILEASFLAMKKAIGELSSKTKTQNPQNSRSIILLDGNKPIPNFSAEQKAIVNGDKLVKSISAASIVAKVTRDRLMHDFHQRYPQYGFDKHKGYGTKMHMDSLQKYGPCEIHRQSFAPVRKAGTAS